MSYVGQALKAVSSFFDPGMAAAFTIGESAGVVVRNGNLMIVGDEFNFPKDSIVLDPHRYIDDTDDVTVIRIGEGK